MGELCWLCKFKGKIINPDAKIPVINCKHEKCGGVVIPSFIKESCLVYKKLKKSGAGGRG